MSALWLGVSVGFAAAWVPVWLWGRFVRATAFEMHHPSDSICAVCAGDAGPGNAPAATWEVVTVAEGGWDEGKSVGHVAVRVANKRGSYRVVGHVDPMGSPATLEKLKAQAERICVVYNEDKIA